MNNVTSEVAIVIGGGCGIGRDAQVRWLYREYLIHLWHR
jgi:hypothetical protein